MTKKNRYQKQSRSELKTFTVPLNIQEVKEDIQITTNKASISSKEKIINQAIKFHLEGNILEASRYYKHFIDQGFYDYRVFSNYGVILKGLGKKQEAEICTRKAIQLNPDFIDAYSNLGDILKDLGKLEEAEIWTRKAIELKPDFANAYSNLGTILRNLGKSKEAEISYRKAIEIKPDYAEAYSNLGNILIDLGKLQEAENYYKKIMSIRSWSILGSYSFNHEMKLD